jgi:endonuclease/exonuclease/phosphatase family metal-dependent hydrolase
VTLKEKKRYDSVPLDKLKIVSYNVLFVDSAKGQERAAELFSILEKTDADIICLMEGE